MCRINAFLDTVDPGGNVVVHGDLEAYSCKQFSATDNAHMSMKLRSAHPQANLLAWTESSAKTWKTMLNKAHHQTSLQALLLAP